MIYQFNSKNIQKINQIGGKAKALLETTIAGFPVPDGVVLSVRFFKDWLDDLKSSEEWKNLTADLTKEGCDKIKTSAAQMQFNPMQRDEFETNLSLLKDEVLAVRSSSPEEDLDDSSFAGMYETYLGVSWESLEKHIALAFSSCFDFRVMEYKRQKNIPLENTAIAIIIQKQLQSEVSGVGFSLNPLNNAYDEVLINASFGLGEAIVSGLVSPDIYTYDFPKSIISDKQINEKKISLWLDSNGGVIEKENQEPTKQALTDEQIIELAKLIKKCESHYKKPIDIEWAYENDKLYLLQARPITTYVPLYPELVTLPGENKSLYLDILSITQGFSDPLSVLGSDIWKSIMITSGGGMLSCTPDGSSPILHGRQFFNVYYLYKSLGKAVGNSYIYNHGDSVEKIMETIDPRDFKITKTPKSLKGRKWAMLKFGIRFAGPSIKAMMGNYDKQVVKYLNNFNEAHKNAETYSPKDSFRDTVDTALVDISKVIFATGLLMAGVSALSKMKKMFKGSNAESELAAIGMDLKGNPTSAMGRLMYNLASSVEFQTLKSADEFSARLKERSLSKEFMDVFDEFIDKHGARTFKEIDIASKRSYDDFENLYERLNEINIEESQINKVQQKKEEAYTELTTIAKEGGFERKFKKQLAIFNATFGYREYLKYSTVIFISKLRNIVLMIAKEFVKEGRLENTAQVFDLHIDEISKAQKEKSLDLRKLRSANLKPYQDTDHVKDWPVMIDSRGKIYKPKLEIKDGDLMGTSIAPGKVTGKAKVLHSPYEKSLNPGEIIVTKSTEPSWTPIFINASGVLMEVGGPLQHGGIIAREYGIPCVSGLVGIMDMVEDGDLLEVDGTSGVVRVLDSVEPEELADRKNAE